MESAEPAVEQKIAQQDTRIDTIDFLRGVVMVLMAIDHARTFLHDSFRQFNAEDLTQTTPFLFFTRWITHFCAPVFIFLVGTSAYLMLQKVKSKVQVSGFLITRGLILILLELTLFRMCWQPPSDFLQPFISLLVIWAIGVSMIFLALVIHLPYKAILGFGLAVLLLHNTLASVAFPDGSAMATLWAFLYSGGLGNLPGGIGVFFLYSVLPYFGLVALGFCLGYLYTPAFTAQRRKVILTWLGAGAISLFIILRSINMYGDPQRWQPDKKHFVFHHGIFARYKISGVIALLFDDPGPGAARAGLYRAFKEQGSRVLCHDRQGADVLLYPSPGVSRHHRQYGRPQPT